MSFLNKNKKEIILFGGIIVAFFIFRLYSILSLPIFTDEAIYLRWAQIAKNDANWRFISLTDGKQPMFVWLAMVMMKAIKDPLLAGRLVSVGAGFMGMIGIYFLGKEIFRNRWIGLISGALYLFFPMALVYDRMALYDSLVGAFSIWSLYLTILLARSLRLDVALLLGMVVGGSVLTKTSGFFSLYLLPFSLILINWGKEEIIKRFFKWLGLVLIVVILTYGFYSILRLSPFFHIINEKNTIFVYPLKEWLTHPFTFFVGNWKAIWNWLTIYLTPPVLILIIASFFITKTFIREKLMLLVWFLVPALALALFGRTLYPRFTLFMMLALLPLAAFSLFKMYTVIKNKWLFVVLLISIFILQLRADYFILKDFAHAPIPQSDLNQYIVDWPAGVGIKEAVRYFQEQSEKGKIYIATQGTFGLMPYAFEIYLLQNPNITIEGFWPIGNTIPKKVIEISKSIPVYFVFYQPCTDCSVAGIAPATWKMDVVARYEKVRKRYLTIYRVRP